MTEALLFSLLSMLVFGTYDFFIARPARKISTITLGILLSIGQFFVFGILFLIFGESFSFSFELIYPLLAGFCGFTGILFYSKSLQTGYAGVSSSIANAYPLITIFVATLILGEIIVLEQYIFFILIILGILFLSFQLSEIRSMKLAQCKSSLIYAVGAMFMWAGFVTFFDISVKYFSPITTVLIAEIGNILVGGFLLLITRQNLLKQIKKIPLHIYRDIGTVLICSLFGIFFFAKAFETGSLSFVSAITACSPAITTILARFFLNEHLGKVQYFAIGVLVLGISGLSYVSL